MKQTANKTKINDNCLWYYTTYYKTIKHTKIPLSELSESSEETWSVKKHQNRKKTSKLLLILSVILYCLQRFSYHNLLHSRCVHACTHHIQRKRANTEIKGFFLWVQRSSVWAYLCQPKTSGVKRLSKISKRLSTPKPHAMKYFTTLSSMQHPMLAHISLAVHTFQKAVPLC